MNRYDEIDRAFTRRYRLKKLISIWASRTIAVLGITSFLFGLRLEPSVTIFRWMTVDGTLFTTICALICMGVNAVEVIKDTELTSQWVYFVRLASAVAESIIFIVVMTSHLPVFDEHLPVFDRYDSFIMHLVIPLLGILTFITNDAPIGRLTVSQRWQGTWFVTVYGAIMVILIGSGRLASDQIPYFFLNFRDNGWGIFITAFVFVYAVGYLMSWGLSVCNRKLSWLWFKNIARR